MRALALSLLVLPAAAAAPSAAWAEPVQEARSATAACLSAIINAAPVEDIDGEDVIIRRGKDPVSCTVTVSAGEPVQIRDAVLQALKRRAEIFSPARTAWEQGAFASRETFCNLPGRKAYAAFISTAKPGGLPVTVVTVFETTERDARCDRDMGLQKVAAAEPAAEPAKVAEVPAKPKKKGLMSRIPGLGKKD